ncbi:hypothetical protein A9Q96_00410 [Rhodobacterales bacterium 52_120_T64]|nr:hypothetical protein A9Q96_00410 [Rhodobacterales bacterium 52_120_T64]
MNQHIDPASPKGGKPNRTLQRLLRKPAVQKNILPLFDQWAKPTALIGPTGKVLAGDPGAISLQGLEIWDRDTIAGTVNGHHADELKSIFQALITQENDIRAIGRESLDRYREITMLYSLSEKVLGATDPVHIATIICEEAIGVLRCDSAAVLLLNAETNRLEIIASEGTVFHNRATRDVGDDLIASVIESGVGEIVNEVRFDSRSLAAKNNLVSVVCSPLRSNEKVFGVLICGNETPRHFNAGDLQIQNAIAAYAAAAIEVERLNRDLAETSTKPVDLIYSVNEIPPVGVSLVLAIQHAFLSIIPLAHPVLITLESGGDRLAASAVVSMSLIAMAIGTVVQSLRHGPIGSGYFGVFITSAIFVAPAMQAARLGGMSMVFGMTVFSGILSLGLSGVFRRFRRLFPPEVSGVVVLMVGLSLVMVALPGFVGLGKGDEISESKEWIVGLVTLGTIMLFSVTAKGSIRLYATAAGFVVGYAAAAFFGLFDSTNFDDVSGMPIFGFQSFNFPTLSFDIALVLPFVIATLAANLSDAGLIVSSQKANDANWKRPDTKSLGGGIVATGISNITSGVLGGVGTNISGGSIGLANASGVTSRRLGLYLAVIFVVMALTPKLTAVLAFMPLPVIGAGLLFLAVHLVSSGIALISSRMLDARRNFVVGIPLLAGVGTMAMPDLFAGAPDWLALVVNNPLALATILALTLNIALNAGVANHASTKLKLDNSLNEKVNSFVSRQGASWGARGEVVRRAAPAITEWCEELTETMGTKSVSLDLHFDDFKLIATIKNESSCDLGLNFDGDLNFAATDRTARNIARRYGCGVKMTAVSEIVFDFEH